MNVLTVEEIRDWFASVDDEWIEDFMENGLTCLIEELEQDDFFGTEGFNKRFA